MHGKEGPVFLTVLFFFLFFFRFSFTESFLAAVREYDASLK